jgi:hypothetical protein
LSSTGRRNLANVFRTLSTEADGTKASRLNKPGKLYLSEVGESFKYAKPVPVLHKLPHFDPMGMPRRSENKNPATTD